MLGEEVRDRTIEHKIRTLVGLEDMGETGWPDRLIWAGNVVARRTEMWKEIKLEEKYIQFITK